jgi:hypothetical protein
MYIMTMQKQQERGMTSIRVSDKLRARLARIRARLTLRNGTEMSMEELIEMLADAYEEKESSKK